jgi:nucleotide-binding universal stress UspA family protein
MKRLKKIMVACDLSAYSKNTLAYAAGLADVTGAELVIVNVINQRDVDTILKVAQGQFDRNVEQYIKKSAKEYVQNITGERTRALDELIKELDCGHLKIKKIFKTGVPLQQLEHMVEVEKPDMMVMGPKGHSDMAGVLFGSVAEKMFRRCKVALLSVRPEDA